MTWYYGIGIGVAAATLRFLLGWLKSGEPWEGAKMLRTLGIGVIGGGVTGAFWTLGVKELFAAVYLETVAAEEVLLGASRQIEKARG